MKPDSNKLFLTDLAVIILISIAISIASSKLIFMTYFVFSVIALRMLAVAMLAKKENIKLSAEIIFFVVCILLGAFNDWNSVCHKKIYNYTVPTDLSFSTIPLWMLVYWGMILRFIARFARWEKLNPPQEISNTVKFGKKTFSSSYLKVILQLLLVFATRQTIYVFYLHPFLSWLPFLLALIIYFFLFLPDSHDLKMLLIFLVGGPLIEIIYIKIGGLHYYYLGWIAGVPLWIALWWLIIILIWKDFAFRVERFLIKRSNGQKG